MPVLITRNYRFAADIWEINYITEKSCVV